MGVDTRQLIEQALRLPVPERARLISELLASIDEGADQDSTEAWAAEIERRAQRALSGESKGNLWAEVRAELEAKRRPH